MHSLHVSEFLYLSAFTQEANDSSLPMRENIKSFTALFSRRRRSRWIEMLMVLNDGKVDDEKPDFQLPQSDLDCLSILFLLSSSIFQYFNIPSIFLLNVFSIFLPQYFNISIFPQYFFFLPQYMVKWGSCKSISHFCLQSLCLNLQMR